MGNDLGGGDFGTGDSGADGGGFHAALASTSVKVLQNNLALRRKSAARRARQGRLFPCRPARLLGVREIRQFAQNWRIFDVMMGKSHFAKLVARHGSQAGRG